MLPDKRRQEILRLTKETKGISISDLADYFKVSNMTILRDVKELAAKKVLDIVRGGVVPLGFGDTSVSIATIYEDKKRQSLTEKQQIANYCAKHFVQDGNIVSLEGGSTCCALVGFLENKKKVTLISNGYFVLKEAIEKLPEDSRIISTGGLLDKRYLVFLGPDVEKFMESRYTDIAFISCVAFDLNVGPMDSVPLDVSFKQAIMKNAKRRVLMVDKNKFNHRSVMQTIDMGIITDLVTNESVDKEILEELKKFTNVKVHLA